MVQLIQRGAQLLEVESNIVEMGLSQMITSGALLFETVDGESLAFMPHLRYAEQGIAERVHALAVAESTYPAIQFDNAVAWCEGKTGKVLAASQREALLTVLTNRVAIITGGPGVGKTTLVNSILTILQAKSVKCLLCAPTGRAAKRLSESTGFEAKTIHRLLEVHPGTGKFARNDSNPLDCDLLVMDETSMVDVTLMNHALRALPAKASLILVGDVDQLPSVGPGRVLGDLIDSKVVPVVRLTEVFRQAAGSQIITTAHRIRGGRVPEPTSDSQSDFFFISRDEPEQIAALIEEMVRTRIPKRFGLDSIRDVQVLCPMNRGSLGVRELNQQLQRILNPVSPDTAAIEKFGWRFQIRDKVIQTENNYDKEVFNGDIGTIEAIDRTEQEVGVRFDDRLVPYDFSELDELSLAYAVTIHKAQGSEFPAVVIPLATQHYTLLQRNLIYTGITRGRSLVVVVGQKKAFALAVRNNRSQKRYSGLLDCLLHRKTRSTGSLTPS
jgi:exodeoxyribonuclease V alpha subunit